jgi:hypothetical protein
MQTTDRTTLPGLREIRLHDGRGQTSLGKLSRAPSAREKASLVDVGLQLYDDCVGQIESLHLHGAVQKSSSSI